MEDVHYTEPAKVTWQWYAFKQLSVINCYKLLQLRAKIFIEEQGYVYNDLDEQDFNALHLLGFAQHPLHKKSFNLIAYARLMFSEKGQLEIGRVVVDPGYRQHGIGSMLMQHMVQKIDKDYPHHQTVLKIGTDQYSGHLAKFYQKFGFVIKSGAQPAIHENYRYKNFEFPTYEMERSPKIHRASTKAKHFGSSIKQTFSHAICFFSRCKRTTEVQHATSLKPTLS